MLSTQLFVVSCMIFLIILSSHRVRLNKRRTRAKSAMNSKLLVRHREMTEQESYAQVMQTYFYY